MIHDVNELKVRTLYGIESTTNISDDRHDRFF